MDGLGERVGQLLLINPDVDRLHRFIWIDTHANDIVKVMIKVDSGIGDVFDRSSLYGLDAIQRVVGQLLVFIMEGEQEPTLVVFLQIIRMDNRLDDLACLIAFVGNRQRLLVGDALEQGREEGGSFEFLVLVEANNRLRACADGGLQMGTHLFHPAKARHTLETTKEGNGLGELGNLILIERIVVNGEMRIFVAIANLSATANLLYFDMPSVLDGQDVIANRVKGGNGILVAPFKCSITLVKYLLSRITPSILETSVNDYLSICTTLDVCHTNAKVYSTYRSPLA